MDRPVKLAFIGAGAIHFGGSEGPWDHATRLEKIGGVNVVAIVDPFTSKAQQVLDTRKAGKHGAMYANCQLYTSVDTLLDDVLNKPDVALVGTPPQFRGGLKEGLDMELKLTKAGIHLFVEKPVSSLEPEEFENYVTAVEEARQEKETVISVGYMLRYHDAVMKMMELIKAHGRRIMSINLRYYFAYSEMDHAFWWNVAQSGGPIVEQATHFCDLARYLCGDIIEDSIAATCLKANNPAATLNKMTKPTVEMDQSLPEDLRVPRVTSAHWHFKDNGVGSLMHTVALHGEKYEASLDVQLDGLRLTLWDPYTADCKLSVRKSGSDEEEIISYATCDQYETELRCFLEAVKGRKEKVACSYTDAAKTYRMSWLIRRQAENNGR